MEVPKIPFQFLEDRDRRWQLEFRAGQLPCHLNVLLQERLEEPWLFEIGRSQDVTMEVEVVFEAGKEGDRQ